MSKQPSKANEGAVCFRTSIGGQALLEGILMRGPQKQAIVCRTPDGLVEKVGCWIQDIVMHESHNYAIAFCVLFGDLQGFF